MVMEATGRARSVGCDCDRRCSAWILAMAGSRWDGRACANCDSGRSKGLKEAGRRRSDRWVGFLRETIATDRGVVSVRGSPWDRMWCRLYYSSPRRILAHYCCTLSQCHLRWSVMWWATSRNVGSRFCKLWKL
jgi:hypothetical protein